ncbi:DUF3993 domain-containing protein [Bacillus sp. AGMB 02131]|uniref:DUF3993 domain-containing protein n=1 Tax=Peribacillus faecalis TaxID=2772559 RepID=A0A927H8V6_9BACI|nr:DUF3993 domain-containing protein [Peribacillus faecalis]MBD3106910.1 DUF3993 domain-containing protein [Peribacillus faecalis]
MKNRYWLLLTVIFLTFAFGSFASAEEAVVFDYQMIELTKEAAEVPYSLSDKGYSYVEVKKKMSPYFTESFIERFITINMMKDKDGLFYVLGTDFPIYYIPFFMFEGDTWVLTDAELDRAAVYEFFPQSTEGPIGYDDHYEAVIFAWVNDQWKIKAIDPQFDPNQFVTEANKEVNTVKVSEQSGNIETEESKDRESSIAETAKHCYRIVKSALSNILEWSF